MALTSLPALSSLSPYQGANQSYKTLTTQAEASFEKALIDITTSDGDTVTLQRSTSHTALSQCEQWQNCNSQGMAFNAKILDSHSFSYTVQGDLSEEELNDLGNLFDTLSVIAEDFFQGNLDEALTGALNIGDMGSLSSLSATFSKSEMTATRISSNQTYALPETGTTSSEENAIARHRQAQWQQILNYFETRKPATEQSGPKEAPKIKDHAQEMMARIKQSLERHPRLAPLIQQLTDKAIADQQPGQPGNDMPSLQKQMDQEFNKMHSRSQWI